ncbi:general secretion pathway protein [Flavobacterium sp.]|uniref:general secretion pathway protein n=1 Tax=Flavobacterium sp. TaxID=239 RepID=UPI00261A5AE5|nr:general secretion pathway protein [Flavobacterium sp.]
MELYCLNSEDGIAVLHIKKKAGELFIENKEKRSSIEKLTNKLNKELPVFLTINNNQVIHKEIDTAEGLDSKLLHKAFANIKMEDFFYQIWRLDEKAIIAICRKNYIEELLQQFEDLKISITSISLGICGLSQIIDYTDSKTINTNSQSITLEKELILNSNQDPLVKTYDINGLEIQNTYLLGFCSVLQKIAPSINLSGSVEQINEKLYEHFSQNSFFKKGLRLMIFTLLSILLINFFLFNFYYKKSIESSSDVLANKDMITQIKLVKQRLKEKEAKLKNSTDFFDSKSSFLVNELVKDLPNSILLNELVYHPLKKNIKLEEALVFDSNVVTLSGITTNAKELTNWFEQIATKSWVKSTDIVHFGKNENNQSVFTLQVNLKPNEIK